MINLALFPDAWKDNPVSKSQEPVSSLPKDLDQERVERIRQALKTFDFSAGKEKISSDIFQITPQTLKELIEEFFIEGMEQGRFKENDASIETLSEIIPLEVLEKAVGTDPKLALEKAKGLFTQAKYYLEQKEFDASPSFLTKLSNFLDSILAFIEAILATFGIADFFEHADTSMQKDMKLNKVMILISFFNMLTMLLVPVVEASIAAAIIGGTLLVIGAASLIYHYFPPAPSYLPHAKNWTKECQNAGDVPLVFSKGRKEILDEMAQVFIQGQNGKLKKHPLLIGPSRVGKTQTAKAFAQAIERGDYPELNGKKVFYLNATNLCKKGDFLTSKDPIEQISEALDRHRDDYILVIDEIHVAFQTEKNSHIGQKLKEMLDVDGDFPNVIGITTQQEFSQYISKDQAFVNRFHPIQVKSTSAQVTQEILSHTVITSEEHPYCEKQALKLIYEKTKEMPQPYASNLILQDCILETSAKQISPLNKKIQKINQEKDFLISQGTVSPIDFEADDEISVKIEELNKELKGLEAEFKKEKNEFNRLLNGKKLRTYARMELYRTVMKINAIEDASQLTSNNKTDLAKFLLQGRFFSQAVDGFVKTQAKKLGVNAVIDEGVVQKCVDKWQKTQELKQGVENGKNTQEYKKDFGKWQKEQEMKAFEKGQKEQELLKLYS